MLNCVAEMDTSSILGVSILRVYCLLFYIFFCIVMLVYIYIYIYIYILSNYILLNDLNTTL